jgi:hypothetical protein
MPITFTCSCGKRLTVKEEHAGRRVTCPKCEAVTMPPPEPAPAAVEVVEVDDIEVIEDEPPRAAKSTAAGTPKHASVPRGDDKKKKSKKKKDKSRPSDPRDSIAQQYLDEAERNMRRDAGRARAAGGRGDDADGLTMFGVHLTGGTLAGAGMLALGLLSMAFIGAFRAVMPIDMRIFIGAMVFTALGGITLLAAIFGEPEDD